MSSRFLTCLQDLYRLTPTSISPDLNLPVSRSRTLSTDREMGQRFLGEIDSLKSIAREGGVIYKCAGCGDKFSCPDAERGV